MKHLILEHGFACFCQLLLLYYNYQDRVKIMSKTSKDVITLMEKEWPVMTAEFRKLQREQYELFLHNNTIMVQEIFQLEHN